MRLKRNPFLYLKAIIQSIEKCNSILSNIFFYSSSYDDSRLPNLISTCSHGHGITAALMILVKS